MFQDNETTLWQDTALTTDAVSTNTYDLGAAPITDGPTPDPSIGNPLCVVVTVGVAASVDGTQTYQFDLIQSDAAALTSPDILASFPFTTALATTLLVAGAILVLPYPPGSITKRYIGIQFDGANTPTITVTAFITAMNMVQKFKAYGTKINVL